MKQVVQGTSNKGSERTQAAKVEVKKKTGVIRRVSDADLAATAQRYLIFDDGVLPLTENKDVFLGRECNTCDIFFFDERVSRRHARVFCRNGKYYVQDLESRNGVFVNGKRVHGAVELVEGDLIELKPHEVHFVGERKLREHEQPTVVDDAVEQKAKPHDESMRIEVDDIDENNQPEEPQPSDQAYPPTQAFPKKKKQDVFKIKPTASRKTEEKKKKSVRIKITKKKA